MAISWGYKVAAVQFLVIVIIVAMILLYYSDNQTNISNNSIAGSTSSYTSLRTSTVTGGSTTGTVKTTVQPAASVAYVADGTTTAGKSTYTGLFLNKSFTSYICAAASRTYDAGPGLTSVLWSQSVGLSDYSSVGIPNSSSCVVYTMNSSQDTAVAGIGFNASSYSLYYTSNGAEPSFTLTSNVPLLIIVSTGMHDTTCNSNSCAYPSVSSPPQSYCPMIVGEREPASSDMQSSLAAIFVCSKAVPGNYELNGTMLSGSSTAVYVAQ